MFARWKKSRSVGRKGCLLYAVIVKSVRTKGKSRQVTVAYLASIRENDLKLPHMRVKFWKKAREKIKPLNLDQTTIEQIGLKLKDIVPFPTEAELARTREEALGLRSKMTTKKQP
jgi:hypothetical protein